MRVWLNGEFVDEEKAKVPITCHALHYGTSVFEGIRSYKLDSGEIGIFRLKEHIDRFFNSMKALRMKVDFSKEEVMEACMDAVIENDLEDAYVRPVAFFNFGNIGLDVENAHVDVAVFAIPFPKYLGDKAVSVKISSFRRISNKAFKVEAKVGGHYVNSVLAHLDASLFGYDEALLLDEAGFVAEGPGENVFFVKGNTLYTPRADNILNGITRQSVIEFSQNLLGLEVEERHIWHREIKDFEEAFFTGTAAEITPIKRIGDHEFSDFKITERIKSTFYDIVRGRVEEYKHWLSVI